MAARTVRGGGPVPGKEIAMRIEPVRMPARAAPAFDPERDHTGARLKS